MGIYDTIAVTCPHCNKVNEEQIKGPGACMNYISLDEEVDIGTAKEYEGEWRCEYCKKEFLIVIELPTLVKLKKYKIG